MRPRRAAKCRVETIGGALRTPMQGHGCGDIGCGHVRVHDIRVLRVPVYRSRDRRGAIRRRGVTDPGRRKCLASFAKGRRR